MRFLSSCGCVNVTLWIHHMDTNKTSGEKARWELCKNTAYCFDEILEATPLKIAAVWLLTPYLKNHPSLVNKTCRTLLEKQG